ncbi:hypothetical protein, variant [Verruconis gallopava]|uniref:Zn(2)-C6 fungal-type domain-containing protein n=1 Tax=Verruconis gallopava TaxID=253628 RepID=A0A0D2B4F7_9PEZI|nr:uncharacterized protein PV09_03276 [Verruconis gallopava]XP_016215978.1 hypothetical protein, variant [Verruconis gallopava]KIW06108.1 hypothetical protein PV09_03276 [Verruconis gallopava]KIW06109.1 hypothetical protein, variant [Verruconis gallopava]
MARKGSRKVRTGCFTCKIRKVKCDETRPTCTRCTSTGRKCDGYPTAIPTQDLPLVATRGLNATGYQAHEARGLEFFYHVAGPGLAGLFDDDFWTRLILQISHREPAVRHVLMAISSLYSHDAPDASPVSHYNAAIQHIVKTTDGALAISMAVLFTCVEFMQGNASAALNHCRHAILIFNNFKNLTPAMRRTLLPILVRLNAILFFFAADATAVPMLGSLDSLLVESFSNATEAHAALQALLVQTIRLVRSSDEYRLGAKRQERIHLRFFAEQHRIQLALASWRQNLAGLHANLRPSIRNTRQHVLLEMGSLVKGIWLDSALYRREIGYDEHNHRFGQIVALASRLQAEDQLFAPTAGRKKFSFDMCFLPLLYFTAVKCRVLELRIAALAYMKMLSEEQEGLWKTATLAPVAQRLIEIEHGVDVNDRRTWNSDIPPEESRVRECMLDPTVEVRDESDFVNSRANRLTCIMWREPDELYARDEWLFLPCERRRDHELANAYSEAVSSFHGFLKQMIGPLGLWSQVI